MERVRLVESHLRRDWKQWTVKCSGVRFPFSPQFLIGSWDTNHGRLLHSERNVQECDATKDDSSNAVGYIKQNSGIFEIHNDSFKGGIYGGLAEWYCTGLLSWGWGDTQVSSTLTLSAMFVMNEFDEDEWVICQYLLQTNGQIAPMVERWFEEPVVQVRVLLCPQHTGLI